MPAVRNDPSPHKPTILDEMRQLIADRRTLAAVAKAGIEEMDRDADPEFFDQIMAAVRRAEEFDLQIQDLRARGLLTDE